MAATRTEELVHRIASTSFFSPCSFLSPVRADNGEELCDVLVVVDPDVIVFSIKEVQPKVTGDYNVDAKRWSTRAVASSIKQLKGARRTLERGVDIYSTDGQRINLPPLDQMRIRTVGIAFGGKEDYYINSNTSKDAPIYTFDGECFELAMGELDTITDFLTYLDEVFRFTSTHQIISDGGDMGALCSYLLNGRRFVDNGNPALILSNRWDEIQNDARYKRKKELDRVSYLWDELIVDVISGGVLHEGPLSGLEIARELSRETRLKRRLLGAFLKVCYVEPDEEVVLPYLIANDAGTLHLFESDLAEELSLAEECAFLASQNSEVKRVIAISGGARIDGKPWVSSVCVVIPSIHDTTLNLDQPKLERLQKRLAQGEPRPIPLVEFPETMPEEES